MFAGARRSEVLRQWRDVRPACTHSYVSTAVSGARFGRRGLATALGRAIEAAGLDRPETTPHKLRHAFACLMLRNGALLNCLQRMLGHTRLDTTGVYLEVTAEDLREVMGRHPLSHGGVPRQSPTGDDRELAVALTFPVSASTPRRRLSGQGCGASSTSSNHAVPAPSITLR